MGKKESTDNNTGDGVDPDRFPKTRKDRRGDTDSSKDNSIWDEKRMTTSSPSRR